MKYDFAALRFAEDENIKDRVYWYLADFPVKEGEEVLAPVGVHDRLQKARVERTASADEKDAPYDLRLIKRVAAKFGARKLVLGGVELIEFGGVKYDAKHYTRFGHLLYAESVPTIEELKDYGIDTVFEAPMSEDDKIYRALIGGHEVLLVGGEGREIMRTLLAFLRGEKEIATRLYSVGLYEKELATLTARLG